MINHIDYINVKNRSGSHDLAPFQAIVGPNFSGKTAVADAIKIGLLGHHPDLGSTGAATMQLTSADSMAVALHTKDGVISRSWVRKGKSVKATNEGSINWEPSWLDARQFINASARERIRLVIQGKAGGADEAIAKLGIKAQGGKSFEELEEIAKAHDDAAKEARLEVKRWEGMLQGSAVIESEDDRPPKPDLGNATKAVLDAQDRLSLAKRDLEELQTRKAKHDEQLSKAKEFEGIDASDAKRSELVSQLREARTKEQERAKEQAKVEAEAVGLTTLISRRKAERLTQEELQAAYVEIAEAESIVVHDHYGALKAWQDALNELVIANAQLDHAKHELEKAQKQLDEFDSLECCPTCKASSPGWKETVRASLAETVAERMLNHGKMTDRRRTADKNEQQAKETYDIAMAKRKRREAAKALAERVKATEETFTAEIELAELQPALERARDTTWMDRVDELEQKIEEIDRCQRFLGSMVEAPPLIDIVAAERKFSEAKEALREADDKQEQAQAQAEAWMAWEARARNASQARQKLDEAAKRVEEETESAKMIRAAIKEATEALWGKISAVAARLSGVLKISLSMNATGEIGYWNGPTWVPFEAMSGSEKLVAATAIQIGLQHDEPQRIIIVDELSRMTWETKGAFADAITEAIQDGIIHQAIMIDHDEKFWKATACATIVIP